MNVTSLAIIRQKESLDRITKMTPIERKKFYDECMDCRVVSFGSIEAEEVDEFYRLINEYADKKYAALKKQLEFQK